MRMLLHLYLKRFEPKTVECCTKHFVCIKSSLLFCCVEKKRLKIMEANFLDYEILGVISDDSYKVKCKRSSKIYVWKVVSYGDRENDKIATLENVVKRVSSKDTNVLKFYGYVQHKETDILYAMLQYCKFGSLYDVIVNCKKKSQYISEAFLWNILLKITQCLKSSVDINPELITVKNVYLNKHCDVKFYNFNDKNDKLDANKNPIGVILHQLATLSKIFDKKINIPTYYSNCFRNNISYLLSTDVRRSIDIILCHPSVISASSQQEIEIFVSIETTELNENSTDTDINLKIENLRNRETALIDFEKRLRDKERLLNKREKRILRLEKTYHEKQKKELLKQLKKHGVSDNFDKEEEESLYANCDDSIIIPTSKKIDFVPPVKFSRSLSERRVRFKGHSPLKEIHNIQHIDFVKPKGKTPQVILEENFGKSDSEKSSERSCETSTEKSGKSLKKRLSLLSVFSKQSKAVSEPVMQRSARNNNGALGSGVRPISWTEETKKQAYDLLRVMNNQELENNITVEKIVKHTCL